MQVLKTIRKDRGISQIRLSAMVGITQGYLSEIENGKVSPSLDTAVKLAKALGCTVDDLLKEQ